MRKTWVYLLIAPALTVAAFLVGRATGIHSKKDGAQDPAAEEVEAAPGQLWTCGMHPQVIRKEPGICPICHMKLTPLRKGRGEAGGTVTIDPVVVQNMGLRVSEVTRGPLTTRLRAAGYLREAQPAQRDFSLKVGGWVEKLHAHTDGMHLRKGEPLLELYSPSLLTAQEELIAARRALEALPSDAGPAVRREAEALLETAKQKLLLWDLAPEDVQAISAEKQARPTITFQSPMQGHLIERLVVEGSSVEPGQKLFRIVDHSTLWLDAQIYEQQMPFVSMGQTATARVAAFPGKSWQGSIIFIHPHMSEATRTATARIQVENSGLILKPGMYATVEIESRLSEEAVLVPRSAVIDTGVRQIAFVAREGGRFDPRELRVGAENDEGLLEVVEGLKAGERVVVSGQFLLDVESRTQEAIQKLLSGELLSGGHPPSTAQTPPPLVELEVRERLRPEVDGVLSRYLELSRVLSSDDEKKAPESAAALANAARALVEKAARGPLQAPAEEVHRRARALSGQPLKESQKSFKPLSDAVISLVARVPPSSAVGEKLYVLHCPMFPGEWLQADPRVANPFYGGEMLECGEVVRTIQPETGR